MPSPTDQLATNLAAEAELLLTEADLTPAEHTQVPPWWLECSRLEEQAAMPTALDEWRRVIPGRLPLTEALFRSRSAGVYLARLHTVPQSAETAVVLVYALHNENPNADGPFTCWFGYPPSQKLENGGVDLGKLPDGVRAFYTQLHDYFHLAGLGSVGFMASDQIFTLNGDPDSWEFDNAADSNPEPLNMIPVLLDNSASVCIELTDNTDDDSIGWILYGSILDRSGPMWSAIDERIVEISNG